MTHVPSHLHQGSLCSLKVEPTPGLSPFPAPVPLDAAADLCPECRRLLDVYALVQARAASRPGRFPPRPPIRFAEEA